MALPVVLVIPSHAGLPGGDPRWVPRVGALRQELSLVLPIGAMQQGPDNALVIELTISDVAHFDVAVQKSKEWLSRDQAYAIMMRGASVEARLTRDDSDRADVAKLRQALPTLA